MKGPKLLITYLAIAVPVMAVCIFLIISGTVSLFLNGYGIDSSGNVYLGKDTKIEKYYNGAYVGTINPRTSRGYAFTVQSDDTLLLSTASTVYIMDLDGNILSQTDDVGTKIYNKLQSEKKEFFASDGSRYIQYSSFGRTIIAHEEGDIVYKMPLLDYVVKLLFCGEFIFAIILIPIIIYGWRKETFLRKP